MNENENLVATEEVIATENTEQTAEETPAERTYTQKEVDEIVGKRIARNTAKIKKDYDRRYGDLVNTLEAGTGKKGVEELNTAFREFYTETFKKKGKDFSSEVGGNANYNDSDAKILGAADAEEVIRYGDEEAAEEFERLEKRGTKMSARERETFRLLAEHLQTAKTGKELSKLGVGEEVYNSKEFKDFAAKYRSEIPITEVYTDFQKLQPKKEFKTAGSMRQGQNNGEKDFYTPEEISRLSEDDLSNPKVWEKVRRSMTGR